MLKKNNKIQSHLDDEELRQLRRQLEATGSRNMSAFVRALVTGRMRLRRLPEEPDDNE